MTKQQVTINVERTIWCAGASLLVSALLFLSFQSIISAGVALVLCIALARLLIGKEEVLRCAKVFLLYALLATLLYQLHLFGFPEYIGFSGPPGLGTDDSYYFSLAAPTVPAMLPLRPYFYLQEQSYSDFLRIFALVAQEMYQQVHPLDLIFISIAVFALLPSATSRLARNFDTHPKIAQRTWWLVLFCPFLLANGLVLLRDGIAAVTAVVAMTCFLERRYTASLAAFLAAAYIRPEHAVLVAGTIWILYWVRYSAAGTTGHVGTCRRFFWVPMLILPAAGLGMILLVLPAVISPEVVTNLVLRTDFLETFIVINSGGDGSSSVFYQINQLPWIARLPLALAFFFLSPLSDVQSLIEAKHFVARDYLYSAFGIAMIVYSGLFVRGIFYAISSRNRLLIALVALYLVELLVLSQASMQIRHKVPLVPMFYIVVAAGLCHRTSWSTFLATSTSAAVAAGQIVLTGWRLASG